jgi:GTP:adenosylcobinamide-phosphate guanylyltransferase
VRGSPPDGPSPASPRAGSRDAPLASGSPRGGRPEATPASTAALVLAGSRGASDPLARAEGVRHRALLEVGGEAMLLRVVRALRATRGLGPITVSIEEPAALDAVAELVELRRQGALALHRSLPSPSRSVLDVLEGLPAGRALLVTTADHALLRAEIVERFLAEGEASGADLAIGLVAARCLRARFPRSKRTFLPFRDEGYSGANLFLFRTPRARRAAAFWIRAERFRKRPWRLVAAFGPVSLALFLLRRLDLDAALARASRAVGARIAAVRLPFAEAAIDVDRPGDLSLARGLVAGDQRLRSPSEAKPPVRGS